MNPSEDNYLRQVMPVVRKRAKVVFRQKPNSDELVGDAVSLGWEFYQRAPAGVTAKNIAYYACKHAASGRQFRESSRSVTGPNPRRRKKHRRQLLEVGKLANRGRESPAAVAALLVDFAEWLTTLTPEECEVLFAMLGFLFLFSSKLGRAVRHRGIGASFQTCEETMIAENLEAALEAAGQVDAIRIDIDEDRRGFTWRLFAHGEEIFALPSGPHEVASMLQASEVLINTELGIQGERLCQPALN